MDRRFAARKHIVRVYVFAVDTLVSTSSFVSERASFLSLDPYGFLRMSVLNRPHGAVTDRTCSSVLRFSVFRFPGRIRGGFRVTVIVSPTPIRSKTLLYRQRRPKRRVLRLARKIAARPLVTVRSFNGRSFSSNDSIIKRGSDVRGVSLVVGRKAFFGPRLIRAKYIHRVYACPEPCSGSKYPRCFIRIVTGECIHAVTNFVSACLRS